MTWLDYVLIAVIGISVLLGIWRGFIKEMLSILIWVFAFGVAIWFAPDMTRYCQSLSANPTMQASAAFLILFFLALVGGMLLNLLLMMIVDQTEFSPMNRILGGMFGIVRGCLFALIIVMLLSFTSLTQSPNWKNAKLLPSFISAANWIQDFLMKNAPHNIVQVLKQVKAIESSAPPVTPTAQAADTDAPAKTDDGVQVQVIDAQTKHYAPITALS